MANKSPTAKDRVAIAPYNFVSLPDEIALPPQDLENYNQGVYEGHSGYIDLGFTTLSPLYVRGMMNPEDYLEYGKKKVSDFSTPQERKDYLNRISPFFSYNGQKYIPGSSLRGMFRTLVEVISFSKLYEVTDKRMMYRSLDNSNHGVSYRERFYSTLRVPANNRLDLTPKFKAGYLYEDRNKWYIQPAQELGIGGRTSFAKVSHEVMDLAGFDHTNGNPPKAHRSPVHFLPTSVLFHRVGHMTNPQIFTNAMWVNQISNTPFAHSIEGTLVVSGPMNTKHSEFIIFPEDSNRPRINVPDDLIRLYKEDGVPMYRNKPLLRHRGTGVLLDGGQRMPVFYLVENGEVVTFAHCAQARIPYLNSPIDLIPRRLKTTENDMAELMFGYVRKTENGTEARAGRVFFEDAVLQENHVDDIPGLIPKILSNPKPTAFQHYLEQDDPNNINALKDYDAKDAKIRGHKFYWSKGRNPDYSSEKRNQNGEMISNVPEKLQTKIKPVAPDTFFTTRIRFENLTSAELGCLLRVVSLGSNDNLCLRLGMGKPYGLGAIRIEQIEVISINRKARYNTNKLCSLDTIQLEPKLVSISPDEMNKHIKSFNNWLFDKISDRSSLARRFKELKTLLRWNVEADQRHEYMTVEQFRRRWVLPNPDDVNKLTPDFLYQQVNNQGNRRPRQQKSKPSNQYEPKKQGRSGIGKNETVYSTELPSMSSQGEQTPRQEKKQQPRHQKDSILTVKIVALDNDADILCKLPEQFSGGNHTYFIKKRHASGKKIKEAEFWNCRVLEIEKDAEGYYYYLLPVKKMQ